MTCCYAGRARPPPIACFQEKGLQAIWWSPESKWHRLLRNLGFISPFTIHDLRRTFIMVAESLDISAYALKRFLNHKMSNDVTAGYIIKDAERLRAPMQKITDYLLNSFANDIQCLSTVDKVNHAS